MTAQDDHPSGQGLDELRKRFRIPGVAFELGEGNLVRTAISSDAASAHVYLHGAHVTHYQSRGQTDVLFMSHKSHFTPDKAIRGGVPIIFPWFGAKSDDPSAPAHGVARTTGWAVADVTAFGDGVDRIIRLTFSLGSSPATRSRWPHDFELLYSVSVGRVLQLELQVRNPGGKTFTFEEALHTYLAVGDVRKVSIGGLGGRAYLDKPDGFRLKTQPGGPFGIEEETDRVYLDTPDTVTITDPVGIADSTSARPRVLSVAKEHSAATVVWNPWAAKAKAMSDFGEDEWRGMLCVETANVAGHAVSLAPGAVHTMQAVVRVL